MSDHRSASGLQDAVAQCMQQLGVGSAQRVGPTIDDFLAFLESCGVDDFGAVTADSCLRFVGSRLQSGRLASLATQHNRRAALRTLFKTARHAGLLTGDPTIDLDLPPSSSSPTRPLTDAEVDLCRDVAWWGSSRVAAAWALAEATARGGEIAEVTVRNIDLDRAVVKLPGGARTEPRTGELTVWGVEALRRRVLEVVVGAVAYSGGGSSNAGQVSTCRAISSVLVRAGLAGQPAVRPASLAGWAGRRVFEQTGRVEDAARAMGVRSLDRAARLIGLDWPADA
jgi:hypothetical protein